MLLQLKPELHGLARRLGDADLRAIMQFVLLTCIILPVLPNRAYGPFGVLNPFEIWLLVVLIVGMSLGGYIVYKFLGENAGIFLGGVLGGAISSTATTVSYARQVHSGAMASRSSAIVIMIASAVVYVRVLVEITVVAPDFLRTAALPVVGLMALTLAPALLVWLRVRRQSAQMPEQQNPTQLKTAVVFATLYAVVLLALAGAEKYEHLVGPQGTYFVAAVSGLTDMDAITLSTARMSLRDPAIAEEGWRLIVTASLANLVSKAVIAGLLGGRRLLARLAPLFAVPLAGGLAMLLLL